MREHVFVNVCLVLQQGNEALLLLRKNTGYADGYYGLVSGHVENNESASHAMVREAYEEAGIRIRPEDLHLVHIMHEKSNRLNVSFFFTCTSWEGAIANQEPDKCAELAFFPINQLPHNMIDSIEYALHNIVKGEIYSEMGWEAAHSCQVMA